MASIRAVLLACAPDQRGLVAKLSHFIYKHGGNIIDADQHTDHEASIFATRLEWDLSGFDLPREDIRARFANLADPLGLRWAIHFTDERPKIALWVSRQEHCLIDLLGRQRSGDIRGSIELVISNHEDLRPIAEQFKVAFHCFPIDKNNKLEQEAQELKLLQAQGIELCVLAKYMQILSPRLLGAGPPVINIHHSFLPAFPGAQPYHRAFARGVKIIGASAHYVTEELDEGPLIDQDVCRVSHRDSIEDMVRKGKDLEKIVLARAVYLHLERRVLVYGNKTIVFD